MTSKPIIDFEQFNAGIEQQVFLYRSQMKYFKKLLESRHFSKCSFIFCLSVSLSCIICAVLSSLCTCILLQLSSTDSGRRVFATNTSNCKVRATFYRFWSTSLVPSHAGFENSHLYTTPTIPTLCHYMANALQYQSDAAQQKELRTFGYFLHCIIQVV